MRRKERGPAPPSRVSPPGTGALQPATQSQRQVCAARAPLRRWPRSERKTRAEQEVFSRNTADLLEADRLATIAR
eukprot:9369877-Prorocentrum_lima.AAC.1